MRGRRDEVDGAAEIRRTVRQAVAALVDFDRAQRQRIDLVEIAAAVGQVERDAVLQDLQAAQMKAAGDRRAADRDAQLLPIALLDQNAGRVFQHVAQVARISVAKLLAVDKPDRADRLVYRLALLLDARDRQRPGRDGEHADRRKLQRAARGAGV